MALDQYKRKDEKRPMEKNLFKMIEMKEEATLLEYYLLEDAVEVKESNFAVMCYGIEVVKRNVGEDGLEYTQSKTVKNITCSETLARQFLELISSNEVMPISIKDVLDDFVEEGYFEQIFEEKKIA